MRIAFVKARGQRPTYADWMRVLHALCKSEPSGNPSAERVEQLMEMAYRVVEALPQERIEWHRRFADKIDELYVENILKTDPPAPWVPK